MLTGVSILDSCKHFVVVHGLLRILSSCLGVSAPVKVVMLPLSMTFLISSSDVYILVLRAVLRCCLAVVAFQGMCDHSLLGSRGIVNRQRRSFHVRRAWGYA